MIPRGMRLIRLRGWIRWIRGWTDGRMGEKGRGGKRVGGWLVCGLGRCVWLDTGLPRGLILLQWVVRSVHYPCMYIYM